MINRTVTWFRIAKGDSGGFHFVPAARDDDVRPLRDNAGSPVGPAKTGAVDPAPGTASAPEANLRSQTIAPPDEGTL